MDKPGQVCFSPTGCVVRRDGRVEVYVDREHLASYEECETDIRNVLLVLLAKKKAVVFEKLAEAFGITSETLRQIRRLNETEGLEAVVRRRRGGLRGRPKKKVTRALQRRLEEWFEQGVSIDDVHERVCAKISRATVGNVHKRWAEARAARAITPAPPVQQELGLAATASAAGEAEAAKPAEPESTPSQPAEPEPESTPAQPVEPVEPEPTPVANERAQAEAPAEQAGALRAPRAESAHELRADDDEPEGFAPLSRRAVQYLGSWLLVSLVADRGLHDRAHELLPEKLAWSSVRICLDAVLTALAVRQKCVEGVRRLATSGAAALLIATGAPSPSWARRVLGGYSRDGASLDLHMWQAGELVREAWRRREEGRPVPLFADNHTRPYTGQHDLLWHWRMQDKRARPGASDYYVHDRDGRPLFRFTVSQGSLAQFLPAAAAIAKVALDADARFILGFDRGGAFPEAMAALRVAPGVEFITYERAPYRKVPQHRFEKHGEKVEIAGKRPEETETLLVLEDQCNLGKERGRVRRLRVLTPQGSQVNLLTNSQEDAAWLVRTLFARWCQENGFKYGVERWGINQLDGRKVEAFPPEIVIPNRKKRRLEREANELREQEGTLRRRLARLADDKTSAQERASLEAQLAQLLERLSRVEARHRRQPERVEVGEAGLEGRLVHHRTEYKTMIDTLRVAGANAESELAGLLAPHLLRPKEAKRCIQNLLAATGDIKVAANSGTSPSTATGRPAAPAGPGWPGTGCRRLGRRLPGSRRLSARTCPRSLRSPPRTQPADGLLVIGSALAPTRPAL
ncbi:MAG: hypothetical protein QM765_43040 [Myxococcales bacterium]